MARSLRVTIDNLPKVKLALQRNGYPSQKTFAADIGPSLSTVKNFLGGKPIDYENFREICDQLGLDWQAIAYTESPSALDAPSVALEASPFITGAPIHHPRHFFGRERQLKRCFALLKHHPLQNMAIMAPRRSGKTSFLRYLATITTTAADQLRPHQKQNWLPRPELYNWIFVDFQDARMSSQDKLLGHLLSALRLPVPDALDLDGFMDRVSGAVHQPTVILLDEIGWVLQRCPELDDAFWESLRSLATNQTAGNLAFVISAPETPMELAQNGGFSSPFFNIFGYSTTLAPWQQQDTLELMASSPIPFTDADQAWICQQSGGWPFLAQILCSERLFALENDETGTAWQAEGLKQIEPYRYLLDQT